MLTAADVMTTDVVTITADVPVDEIAKLLLARRISGVPVVNADRRVIGIVSETDLIGHVDVVGEPRRSWWLRLFTDSSAMARDYVKTHGRSAREVMTTDVITVPETASVADIAGTLEQHGIKRVPVVRDGRLVGIVTRASLLQALATRDVSKPMSADDRTIQERLEAELRAQPWARHITRNVVVENGVIHLFGFVKTAEERQALRVAAENVPGVRRVEDHLVQWTTPSA